MEITLSNQVQIFTFACIFGGILGLLYDVFRILRLVFDCDVKQIFFQDVIYFSVCGILTFTFALATNYGKVRFFILAGEIIGWCLYHLTIGEIIIRCLLVVIKFVSKFFNAIKRKFLHPLKDKIRQSILRVIKMFKERVRFPEKIRKNQKTT